MGNGNADGRKRKVMIRFRVTERERDFIYEKIKQYHTNNLATYMRKMAIDGYVIHVDYSDLKAVAAEMQKIGVKLVALSVQLANNPNAPLIVKAIGEGFGFLLW